MFIRNCNCPQKIDSEGDVLEAHQFEYATLQAWKSKGDSLWNIHNYG